MSAAEELETLREEFKTLRDDRARALKLAYTLTLDTQTCEEAVASLVKLVYAARKERDEALRWTDAVPDEWTEAVRDAFPTSSGSHDEYATAMKMVGNRRSKGSLVALVNWLLVRIAGVEAALIDKLIRERRMAEVPKTDRAPGYYWILWLQIEGVWTEHPEIAEWHDAKWRLIGRDVVLYGPDDVRVLSGPIRPPMKLSFRTR